MTTSVYIHDVSYQEVPLHPAIIQNQIMKNPIYTFMLKNTYICKKSHLQFRLHSNYRTRTLIKDQSAKPGSLGHSKIKILSINTYQK